MISRLRTFFTAVLRRSRMEEEMSSELRFHMDARIDDMVTGGIPRAEAERRARVEFGPVEEVREECREARGLRWPDELRRNVLYAFRVFRRSPAFTITALMTLALCIGANTAIFSVVDAVLLRPLPYPHPERLAVLGFVYKVGGAEGEESSVNGETWFLIRDHATKVEAAPFSLGSGANFASGNRARYVRLQRVGARFFHVLGIEPLIGREFNADEDRPGGPPVAVLAYGFWKGVLDEDPSVLGRAIMLRGEPHVVVGVMPPEFRSDVPADVWTPLRPSTTGEGQGSNYGIVVRLRPGVTWAEADTQIGVIGDAAVRRMRESGAVSRNNNARMRMVPLQRASARDMRMPLLVLWTAVGAVLLIGCVNIAGLLLAEGAARKREIATRIALGGGRAAVVRQLLTESLVLAVCGSALGIAVGYGGMVLLRRSVVEALGIWQVVELNARVLAAAGAIAFLTSIVFGLVPALEATRTDLREALVEGGMRGVAGGARFWPRRLLVTGEVALGCVLLITAGLLVRTFSNLMKANPGFNAAGVLTAKISLQDARYRSSRDMNRLFDQSLARIRTLPGVTAAAVGLSLPYERPLNMGMRRLDGPHPDGEQEYQQTDAVYVTPEYFRVLRMPRLQGREFTAADGPNSAPVVIVNRAFVQEYLRDQNPIGSHVGLMDASRTIVGVVGDVPRRRDFDTSFSAPAAAATIYMPASQTSDGLLGVHIWFSPSWIVRASGPTQGLIAGVTRAVEAVDPLLPFAGFQMMDDVRAESVRGHRFLAVLLGSLAALAWLLAAIGLYGLISNSVAVRTRELGIRLALGATARQAIRSVTLPGIGLALAGIALGAAASLPAVRLLRSLLVGIGPNDPATFVGVAIGLILTAAAASCLPALRITRLNPAETLRHE